MNGTREIKCDCSKKMEGKETIEKVKSDIGSIHFDICLNCLSELVDRINQILWELLSLDESILKGNRISRLGVYCDQCNKRKVGTFHHIRSLHFKIQKDLNSKGEVIYQKVEEDTYKFFSHSYIVCDECFQETSERKFFIKSGRDVYISESLDKTVENLFTDLEKTNALFTLVPTEILRRVLKPSLEAKPEATTNALSQKN